MYCREIINDRIALAEKHLGFQLEYHTPSEIDDFNQRLEERHKDAYVLAQRASQGVRDSQSPFQNTLIKALADIHNPKLSSDEIRWIKNERALSMCDASYFLNSYYWIKSDRGIMRIALEPAQQIYMSVIAEMEAMGRPAESIVCKARQLGISTVTEGLILHRILFGYGVNAIAASADDTKTPRMAQMIFMGYDYLPWWLGPQSTRRVESQAGMLYFGGIRSGVSFQHGGQSIGRGDTTSAYHLSEVASFPNAKQSIEASLFPSVHQHSNVFGVLESTAEGDSGWFYDTYWYSKSEWANQRARLYPLFLPWYLGTNKYPVPNWIKTRPVPQDWKPEEDTLSMMVRSQKYIASSPLLEKVLGTNWECPREQAWFWECNFIEKRAKGIEKLWYQEMPCVTGDSRISADNGLIRIDEAILSKSTETGEISQWLPRGRKRIWELVTKDGRRLKATPDHKILCADGKWKTLQSLVNGEKITLSVPVFPANRHVHRWNWTPACEMSMDVTPDIGRLLGYFMGDGSFHAGTFEVSIDEKDQDVREDVSALIGRITGKSPTEKKQGKMYRVQSSSVRWLEILKSLGCVQPAIHKNLGRSCGWKRKVCVPESIFRSPRVVVREFLSALFECDGHAYKGAARVILFSAHDEFLRDVQMLLLGFGIRAYFAKQETKTNGQGRTYTGRQLVVPAAFANAFYESIGFISDRKQTSGKRRDETRTWGVRTSELIDEVDSVIDLEIEDLVYDLSIPGPQRFGANGIMVHNCSDKEAFQSSYDNVFGRETIAEVNTKRDKAYHVYGIVGQSIEDRFEPEDEERDHEEPTLEVCYIDRIKDLGYKWELQPLLWKEPFRALEDIRSDSDEHMGKFFVYLEPERGYDYSIGIRTGNGIGSGDTVVAVARRGLEPTDPDIQAAEFRSSEVSHVEAYAYALAIAAYYSRYMGHRDNDGYDYGIAKKEPYVAIEQVQSVGDTCQLQMRKMGYRRFHRMTRYDSDPKNMRKSKASKIGWYSFGWSTPMYVDSFVVWIRNGWYKVNSPYTIHEMDHWERHTTEAGKEKFIASADTTDAGLLANAMAAFCVNDMAPMAERTLKQRFDLRLHRKMKLDMTPTPLGTVFPLTGYNSKHGLDRLTR